MVEEKPEHANKSYASPVVRYLPEGGRFCDRVRAPRSKWCFFICRRAIQVAETFAGRGVIKSNFSSSESDGFSRFRVAA